LAYAAGLFDGAPDGGILDGDLNSGKEVAGRVFLSPFKPGDSVLKNLGFGMAGTTGDHAGVLPLYRSGGQVPMFAYAGSGGGRNALAGGAAALVLQGPVRPPGRIRARDDRTAAGGRRGGHDNDAGLADHRLAEPQRRRRVSYNGVRPRRPFDPAQHHWGALELVARVNGFEVDDLAFAGGFANPDLSVRKAFAWGVGLNWYLSRNLRQYVDYEHTSFEGGAPDGSDRNAEQAILIRTQLAF
jgi:phosphate-selective porin OprO/OprP